MVVEGKKGGRKEERLMERKKEGSIPESTCMHAYILQGSGTKAYFCQTSVLIMNSNLHSLILYLLLIFSDISQSRAAGQLSGLVVEFPP